MSKPAAPSPALPSIPHCVSSEVGAGGLRRLVLNGAGGSAQLYLHGCHVTSFQPTGADDLLWTSAHSAYAPGQPIRGGIPICWPWFGPSPEPGRPAHGIARLVEWEVQEAARLADGRARVLLALPQALPPEMAAWLPSGVQLRCQITVGAQLQLCLETTNAGSAPLAIEDALHSYFRVSDVRQIQVEGLAGMVYRDKCAAGASRVQEGPVRFVGETDRVYADRSPQVAICDGNRRITVAKSGSQSTVVWNPWVAKAAAMPDFGDDEWPGMVCVETANCLDGRVMLLPGTSHRTEVCIG
ncbi:MAG: D-hexose-6-phosphate mutarotase [Planctomycetota bacterium]|nr:MAG: D-hexose-6-phosphate mutarotase [Planctomycetota bacterium]